MAALNAVVLWMDSPAAIQTGRQRKNKINSNQRNAASKSNKNVTGIKRDGWKGEGGREREGVKNKKSGCQNERLTSPSQKEEPGSERKTTACDLLFDSHTEVKERDY